MRDRRSWLAWPVLFLSPGAGAQAPERATLLQIGLDDPDQRGHAAREAALAAEAATISSCAQALGSIARFRAQGLKGSLTVRTAVPLAALPAPLQAALAHRPIGRPTPIFGGPGHLRVLIRCEPSFTAPAGTPAAPADTI